MGFIGESSVGAHGKMGLMGFRVWGARGFSLA